MNQAKNGSAAVLLYNLDSSERARKIKFILIRMGVRIKNIKKEDYLKPIGALAGVPALNQETAAMTAPDSQKRCLS